MIIWWCGGPGLGVTGAGDTSCYPGGHESISYCEIKLWAAHIRTFHLCLYFLHLCQEPGVTTRSSTDSFDKAHLKWKHKVISFSYQIKSPFIASMGSLHPQIGTFKWSRCSNKRVLYALCTFVDIIVNSLICVRAERTGEMFLCLVMEPSWDAAAGVMLCAHLVLSLSF